MSEDKTQHYPREANFWREANIWVLLGISSVTVKDSYHTYSASVHEVLSCSTSGKIQRNQENSVLSLLTEHLFKKWSISTSHLHDPAWNPFPHSKTEGHWGLGVRGGQGGDCDVGVGNPLRSHSAPALYYSRILRSICTSLEFQILEILFCDLLTEESFQKVAKNSGPKTSFNNKKVGRSWSWPRCKTKSIYKGNRPHSKP